MGDHPASGVESDADGEMFGTGRLLAKFRDTLDDILQAIVAELAAFRGDALVKDDRSLNALEFVV